jgi:hypothetical protein
VQALQPYFIHFPIYPLLDAPGPGAGKHYLRTTWNPTTVLFSRATSSIRLVFHGPSPAKVLEKLFNNSVGPMSSNSLFTSPPKSGPAHLLNPTRFKFSITAIFADPRIQIPSSFKLPHPDPFKRFNRFPLPSDHSAFLIFTIFLCLILSLCNGDC